MLSMAVMGGVISLAVVAVWLFRGRMAGVFRRVTGIFSRRSAREKRRNKEEDKDTNNAKNERKKDGKKSKEKRHSHERADGEHVATSSDNEMSQTTEARTSSSPKKKKKDKVEETSKAKRRSGGVEKNKGKNSTESTSEECRTPPVHETKIHEVQSLGRSEVNIMAMAEQDLDVVDGALGGSNDENSAYRGKSETGPQELIEHSALVHTNEGDEDTDVDSVNVSDDSGSQSDDLGSPIMGKKGRNKKNKRKDVPIDEVKDDKHKNGLSNSGFTGDETTKQNGIIEDLSMPKGGQTDEMVSSVDSATSAKSASSADVGTSVDGEPEKPRGKQDTLSSRLYNQSHRLYA